MKVYYKLLKEMPYHSPGELVVKTGNWYIWELGKVNYSLPVDVVENNPDWFEEAFPNWMQNEPCHYISLNGIIISDYFNRETHSSLARFGNLFKSKEDAEIAQIKIQSLLEPFADE